MRKSHPKYFTGNLPGPRNVDKNSSIFRSPQTTVGNGGSKAQNALLRSAVDSSSRKAITGGGMSAAKVQKYSL